MEFFDSHAHYNDERFKEDQEEIIKKIYEENITKVVVAGYSVQSSKEAIELAKKHEFIYAICGISPNDISNNYEDEIRQIEDMCKNNKKIVAIGEIGLDYYWNKDNKELQKKCFALQIELANKLNLPIVIHSRDAYVDTIEVIKKVPANKRGIFHCCQPNQELVTEALKLGFYISFAGPVTFKNAKKSNEIIQMVPNKKILIETDCPYLAPEPLRGTRNNSINVKLIAQKIADIKGLSLEEVAKITYENAMRAFGI